ncbi:response regulator [Candidatus Sumerlaeota bacterium]|nr:response regulator [Candidatus Sumerlaeota bacterium]
MGLPRLIPKSIAARLLALNAVVLLAVGGVIVSNLVLSRQTGRMAMALLDRDVPQAIANAELSRNLNEVCSDINLVLNTFTFQKAALNRESDRLASVLRRAISDVGDAEGLRTALTAFAEAVEDVLKQCVVINESAGKAEQVEATLDDLMTTLESEAIDIIMTRKLEGREYELYAFEQLSASIPDLRGLVLRSRMLRLDYQQSHLGGEEIPAAQEERMTALLAALESGASTASTAGEEIAPVAERLIETVGQYKSEIAQLQDKVRELRNELGTLSDRQSEVMIVMADVELGIARAADNMKGNLAADVRRADNTLLGLSLAVVGVLALVGVYGVRISRPIHDLTISASEIAAGNLDRPIHTSGTDETGVLGRSFARMRDAIREKVHDLAEKNEELLLEIRERRKATEELRESEERYRTLVEDLPVFVCRFLPGGAIAYVNGAYCRCLGKITEDLVGKSFWASVFEEDRERVLNGISSLSVDSPTQLNEYRMVGRGERIRWHRWIHHALFDAEGAVVAYQAIGEDVTERKRADEEKARLAAQLIQAQKMQAVGQLAGGIAHDFNNLLQAIQGHCELGLEELATDAPSRAELESIMYAAGRAAALVKQLLAFSRRQVLELSDLDLNEVIANLLKMIQRVIGENIALDVIPGHNLGTVHADRGQVEQIVMNLCVNARDAMPDGGNITLQTDNVQLDEAFCKIHSWAEPGRYVLLRISDTGCGMSEETLSSIFEPFFTTKDVGQGTGLGLSTVYGIVKQHDGMIHAASEPGRGSTFEVFLPLVERPSRVMENNAEDPAPGGDETILMAEDDELVRNLGKLILEKAGYSVLTAADGEQALRLFDAHSDEIDLALLDVMMPKLSGKAVLDHLRKRRPDTRVVFSSGYSMDNMHADFFLDEGIQLVQKPYQRVALLQSVRKALDSR